MAYVKFNNGVVLEWDETLTVGELITTYNDGYHILTNIDFRDPPPRKPELKDTVFDTWPIEWSDGAMRYSPIFHYTKVLKGNGERSKALNGSCDASYCKRVTHARADVEYEDAVLAAKRKLLAIRDFLPEA